MRKTGKVRQPNTCFKYTRKKRIVKNAVNHMRERHHKNTKTVNTRGQSSESERMR